MQPRYVSKYLSAQSSNGLGSISTAVPSVVTLNTSSLGTGRRVAFYSTASSTSMNLTVTGYEEGSTVLISETIYGSTGTNAASTTVDFLSLTAVSNSSNANIPFLIGTSSVGGTPWQPSNWYVAPLEACGQLAFTTSAPGSSGSSATLMARFETTLDDPTRTYPIPGRGVPMPYASTSPVGTFASSDSMGHLCVDGSAIGPFAAWRMTITSSSSAAGTVYGTVFLGG